jgi:sec-independent protein translocase protein TatA
MRHFGSGPRAAARLSFEVTMFGIGPMEMFFVMLIVLLVFGNRLPSVMRSMGVGITEFKKGNKGEGLTDPNTPIEDKRRDEP